MPPAREGFRSSRTKAGHARLLSLPAAAGEWSRRDASDIDGQARGPNERDANESKLPEFSVSLVAPERRQRRNESRGEA